MPMNYETIMSLIELPPDPDVELDAFKLACFNVSLTSRRKRDKFWLNLWMKCFYIKCWHLKWWFWINDSYLSRFFIDKLRSTFSIKLSNQCAIVCCLSSGWDRIMFSFIDLVKWANALQFKKSRIAIEVKKKTRDKQTWNNLHKAKSNQAMALTMTIDFCNLQT